MKKKKKHNLDNLKVESFITTVPNEREIKGKGVSDDCWPTVQSTSNENGICFTYDCPGTGQAGGN